MIGSRTCLTTVCAIRSATVGTPSSRVPPLFFGIGTAFTGGNVSIPLVVASILVIVGLAALFVARRRAAHAA